MDPDQSVDKSPDSKRPKMEPSNSTSPKFAANNVETPILTLPADILAKIIAFVPTAQWPSLDLLKDFQDANRIAWRGLRKINLDRDLLIKPNDPASSMYRRWSDASLVGAMEYLVDRSPYLTSLSGIDGRVEPDSDVIRSLAKLEHLQSITMGDAQFMKQFYFDVSSGVRLDALIEFLETTRSRTTLKQMQLFNVGHRENVGYHYTGDEDCGPIRCEHFDVYAAAILDRFHSSLFNMREYGCHEWMQIRQPFKLEKFSFSSSPEPSLFIRLDSLDASCLTDLCLGEMNVRRQIGPDGDPCDRPAACVEPVQLTNLIDRAPNLCRIELSFLRCGKRLCSNGPRLQENRELLAALARHKNLTTIKFDFCNYSCDCLDFGPDFIEMLKSIGRRGQLRKLILPDIWNINLTDMCSAIHQYIPYLRSIKLCIRGVNPEIVSYIVSMTELEEVHFSGHESLDPNATSKIFQLPHLKRLSICEGQWNSLEPLANATTLTDLRIRFARYISSDIFEKWSEGFGPNLQTLMLSGPIRLTSEICTGIDQGEEDNLAEGGFFRFLKKAVRLRILILNGSPVWCSDGRTYLDCISDRSMMAIAKSCPELEVLSLRSTSNEITARGLQEIVDRCTKLRRLGGISDATRSQLQFPKYRKICDVHMDYSEYDFDDRNYE